MKCNLMYVAMDKLSTKHRMDWTRNWLVLAKLRHSRLSQIDPQATIRSSWGGCSVWRIRRPSAAPNMRGRRLESIVGSNAKCRQHAELTH